MERTELPTSARLESLREQGIVHYSPAVCDLVAVLAIVAALSVMDGELRALPAKVRLLFEGTGNDDIAQFAERFVALCKSAALLVLAPAIAAGVARFFVGLLQTRFLFRGEQFGILLHRILPKNDPRRIRRGAGALLRLLLPLFVLFLGVTAVFFLARDLFGILNRDPAGFAHWPHAFAVALMPYLVVLLVVAIPLTWLISRMLFMVQFRMTTADIEKETRSRS